MSTDSPWKFTKEELDNVAMGYREILDCNVRDRLPQVYDCTDQSNFLNSDCNGQLTIGLHRMLDIRKQAGCGWTPDHEAMVSQLAGRIRDVFRRQFGMEMISELKTLDHGYHLIILKKTFRRY